MWAKVREGSQSTSYQGSRVVTFTRCQVVDQLGSLHVSEGLG